MKAFSIYGAIVDTDDQRYTFEDVTPAQFNSFIKGLEDGEELEIYLNSPGGSVYGGIAIANMIRQLSMEGHKTTARVEGLAASIASVIMCACDNVILNESSLVMIHNCWSVVQGDSTALRKEADTMDVMNDAILSFYRSKFDLSDETLKEMMDKETWFSGKEAANWKFKCEVIADGAGYAIAAKVKDFDLSKFKHLPKEIKDMTKTEEVVSAKAEAKDETIQEETKEVAAGAQPTDEQKVEEQEKPVEEVEQPKVEEPKVEEAKVDEPVAEDVVPLAECEKRVSGMQSAMAKQMDALKKDYEAKIADFEVQIKAKDEELTKAMALVTSLTDDLKNTSDELLKMTSAFKEKANALDALNASVNTPDKVPTMTEGLKNCKTPSEKVAFLKSGKYVR